eukprot:TRINITY_DN4509_c0_g1_i2.p1 TRINITY_DN4509_c0_g1~~TRINITY_DN4509_c0_g1_i2.p1  ORF type:complete len:197 (-),score=24.27 TRINITY_DN4509_c0_g1_i2:63-653(-)
MGAVSTKGKRSNNHGNKLRERDIQHYQVNFVGSLAVGKSALFFRATEDTFTSQFRPSERGKVDIQLGESVYCLHLLDTGGTEKFVRYMSDSYYRGCTGVLMVFDITNSDSFTGLSIWLAQRERFYPDIKILLVGNKCDLEDQRQVPYLEAEMFAEQQNFIGYVETSAKDKINIDVMFAKLTESMKKHQEEKNSESK